MTQVGIPEDRIWRMILQELGKPHRNALLPFLTVSHALHDLAIPLIYQSIHASDTSDDTEVGTDDDEWTISTSDHFTDIPLKRLPSLLIALQSNQAAAGLTTAFSQTDYESLLIDTTYDILDCLCNLKRLYICVCNVMDYPRVIGYIPKSVALTHLSLPMAPKKSQRISRFLESQSSSLKSLSCGDYVFNTSSTPLRFMQALDTFQGVASVSWDMLANIAKLRHLITSYIDAPAIRNPGKVFANLVSLKVWVDTPLDTFSVIGPYLISLEFLSFSPPEDSAEEIRVYHLTKISSQNLKYIEYFKQDFHPETEVAQLEPIFKHHLNLLACYAVAEVARDKPVDMVNARCGPNAHLHGPNRWNQIADYLPQLVLARGGVLGRDFLVSS
ncbi:hypothetical protein ONZ45_g2446 [Pleurotus djamor]|nr:hypothetical protein ONZ45_g2446 [Pleurotus djamor]